MKKVYIRGAGDLATGIACRLFECGFTVVMTDLEVPTTVRRTVAFSPAIYEETAVVENKTGRYCQNIKAMDIAIEKSEIPIVIDKNNSFIEHYKPEIVIDAIVAKKKYCN